MRKFLMVFMFAFLLIITTACSGGDETGNDTAKAEETKEKIILKFAVSQPESHDLYAGTFTPFMKKVTELSEGKVEFEFYPAEQLGKAGDLLELTSDGVTDIGFYFPPYYPSKMPITSALIQIPGLYSTAYEGTMAYHELSKQSPVLETDFLKNGVRPLLAIGAQPAELWTKGKEIKSPSDIKGMKVRVSGELTNKAVLALNASPVNITLPELYEGLERDVYDSINLNAVSMSDYGLGELIKFGTNGVGFGGVTVGLIINERVFQDLPKDIQNILVEVGDELTESVGHRYDNNSNKIIQGFKENGVNVYELSESEKAQWKNFYVEIEKSFLSEQNSPQLENTLATFRELVKKYN
ncbi:TRAP transporter substrate-binding protein DctP [Psychrobacillus sp. NPDC096426]|uniref:TRAP transporter substrate-binding protein DctP n=1 Tax=Psychrobacillus sp. NPDC096426 TaxID=3364491 RepID=UPI003802E2EF